LSNDVAKIRHVYGNVLRIAIPLTLRTIEVVDNETQATDTDFIPSSEYPVHVEFSKGATKIAIDAEMRNGNVAFVEDKGKIPIGLYSITVTCNDDNGNPYRFKQNAVLNIVDATIDAGIESPIEYETSTWYLDAAIYLALKGEDGVGIEDIETEYSEDIGGMNTVTIILTDGRTRTFTVMNGSGSVDRVFSLDSQHPLSNDIITARFNKIDQTLDGLFGDVDYDSNTKSIRFFNNDKTKVLVSLDARPFIKDGMVSNVYISNNTLVITFNTDSGREAIGVPLSSVFNPNNYYNKTQINNLLSSKADTSNVMSKSEFVDSTINTIKLSKMFPIVLDFIVGVDYDESIPIESGNVYGGDNGHIYVVDEYGNETDLGMNRRMAFVDAIDDCWYRWDGTKWVRLNGGGMPVDDYNAIYSDGNLLFTGSDPTYNNGDLTFNSDGKPTYLNGNLIL